MWRTPGSRPWLSRISRWAQDYTDVYDQCGLLTPHTVLSLCIYRGGPEAVLETYVRGQSVYRSPQPELF